MIENFISLIINLTPFQTALMIVALTLFLVGLACLFPGFRRFMLRLTNPSEDETIDFFEGCNMDIIRKESAEKARKKI